MVNELQEAKKRLLWILVLSSCGVSFLLGVAAGQWNAIPIILTAVIFTSVLLLVAPVAAYLSWGLRARTAPGGKETSEHDG